jgi:hypothetical protein
MAVAPRLYRPSPAAKKPEALFIIRDKGRKGKDDYE